ncbi:MAG: TolC family protein [Acidobacteria bacterium]|nr:TolC family protein [Acidobacteriota bacterium]
MRKIFSFIILVVFATAIFAQGGEELKLSLSDALSYALKNNFDINISKVDYKISENTLEGAKGIYDPQLTFDWGAAVSRQPATSLLQGGGSAFTLYQSRQDKYNLGLYQQSPWGQTFSLNFTNTRSNTNSQYSLFNPTYSSNLSLNTSVPLLKGFGYTNANKTILKAKLDRDAATFTFRKMLRNSLLDVENAYWNLVYAIEQYKVTQQALEVAKEFQKETLARISVGTLAPVEQVSADAQVAQREEELISAENLVINSEDILKLLLGIRKESPEWNKTIVPSDYPAVENRSYDEENSISEASNKREEIKELQSSLEKTKIDTKTAKINLLPSLNLDGSLSYAGSAGDYYVHGTNYFVDQKFNDAWDMITGRDYKSWAIGLSFAFPIGNRAQKFAYQNYRLVENEAEIMLEKTRQSIISEVRNAFRNLLNSEKRIKAAEANLKLQEEKLKSEKKKYDNGLSTSFNVLSYQNDVLAAETTLLKAKIDYQLAVASFEKAKGNYLNFRNIEFDVNSN